jgi:6-phosphogluconolactonase
MDETTASAQEFVFVGSYASAEQPGIHAFHFDAASGALALRGTQAGIAFPSFVVVHPSGRWLYAVSETSTQQNGTPGAVWALEIASETGALRPINRQPAGDAPCHLEIDATGQWLVVSNYASGSVGVMPIGPNGALGATTELIQHHGHGPNPERQEAAHAHSARFAPDNRFVVVADLGMDELFVYAFDSSNGRRGAHARANARPGAGPRHLAFHPNGRHVYVANELDCTVSLYDYDAASGALHARQALDTLPAGAPETTVADIHITPAGDRVFVSNRGHDSIAAFDVGPDGRLEPRAIQPCGGGCPRNFALAPGGRFILVANQNSGGVAVLPLLPGAAAIGAPIARVEVPGASCIQFVTGFTRSA